MRVFQRLACISKNSLLETIAQAAIFVYGSADNQGTPMREANLIHHSPAEGAARTMFVRPRSRTELMNVGQTDTPALAGGRI
jgi:hypothetical protein